MSTQPERVLEALRNVQAKTGRLPVPPKRKTERELTAESLVEVQKVLHEDDGRGFRVPNRSRRGGRAS